MLLLESQMLLSLLLLSDVVSTFILFFFFFFFLFSYSFVFLLIIILLLSCQVPSSCFATGTKSRWPQVFGVLVSFMMAVNMIWLWDAVGCCGSKPKA